VGEGEGGGQVEGCLGSAPVDRGWGEDLGDLVGAGRNLGIEGVPGVEEGEGS
jgi:hypothetical protein